jgi:hypothetical protein
MSVFVVDLLVIRTNVSDWWPTGARNFHSQGLSYQLVADSFEDRSFLNVARLRAMAALQRPGNKLLFVTEKFHLLLCKYQVIHCCNNSGSLNLTNCNRLIHSEKNCA